MNSHEPGAVRKHDTVSNRRTCSVTLGDRGARGVSS